MIVRLLRKSNTAITLGKLTVELCQNHLQEVHQNGDLLIVNNYNDTGACDACQGAYREEIELKKQPNKINSTNNTRLAVTGTERGMSAKQVEAFVKLVHELQPSELHHGCCIGADTQCHQLVRQIMGAHCRIFGYPTWRRSYQTASLYRDCEVLAMAKSPLDRNHDIIAAANIVAAFPKENAEIQRSGTWATVRYGRAAQRKVCVFYPNGAQSE